MIYIQNSNSASKILYYISYRFTYTSILEAISLYISKFSIITLFTCRLLLHRVYASNRKDPIIKDITSTAVLHNQTWNRKGSLTLLLPAIHQYFFYFCNAQEILAMDSRVTFTLICFLRPKMR